MLTLHTGVSIQIYQKNIQCSFIYSLCLCTRNCTRGVYTQSPLDCVILEHGYFLVYPQMSICNSCQSSICSCPVIVNILCHGTISVVYRVPCNLEQKLIFPSDCLGQLGMGGVWSLQV